MFIENIKIHNFRNLITPKIDFAPGVNFIVGLNGHGKSNLLEAVSVLSHGRSFRTNKLTEIIKLDSFEASVYGTLVDSVSKAELGLIIKKGGKELFVDGDSRQLKDYIGKCVSVSFSPLDLLIVQGAPQIRRRFIDKVVIDLYPSLFESYSSLHRALKNKNAVLKLGEAKYNQIEPWNSIIAGAAYKIIVHRNTVINDLAPFVSEVYSRVGSELLEFKMESGLWNHEEDFTEELILEKLNVKIDAEIRQKTSLVGPQRDDMGIQLDNKDARIFASQGQTRSVVLALKLGVIGLLEARNSDSPIVLLDDVDSELDSIRSDAFFSNIFNKNRQVIITGTRFIDVPSNEKPNLFKVVSGNITKEVI